MIVDDESYDDCDEDSENIKSKGAHKIKIKIESKGIVSNQSL